LSGSCEKLEKNIKKNARMQQEKYKKNKNKNKPGTALFG
jgi:hypothetical protein